MTSETSRLLSEQLGEVVNATPANTSASTNDDTVTRTRCTWPWLRVVLLLLLLAFVADVGETLFTAPRIRFVEAIACLRYYRIQDPSLIGPGGFVPERFCQIEEVQSKVMSVMGGQLFFDSISSILLPLPYGLLADVWGRKLLLVIGIGGCTLYLVTYLFLVCATCPGDRRMRERIVLTIYQIGRIDRTAPRVFVAVGALLLDRWRSRGCNNIHHNHGH